MIARSTGSSATETKTPAVARPAASLSETPNYHNMLQSIARPVTTHELSYASRIRDLSHSPGLGGIKVHGLETIGHIGIAITLAEPHRNRRSLRLTGHAPIPAI